MIRTVMRALALSGSLLGLSAPAWSHGLEEPRFSLRGFGTLGAVYHREGEAGFLRDITQPKGARNSLDTDIDSRLGLQLDARLTDKFDATAQVLSRYRYDGSYRPELTWGFLRYTPRPDLEIRLGRLGWDVYMLSDSRDVGYSYLWVRPPVEYYGHLQLSAITGADVVWRHPLGGGVLSSKVFAGEVTSRIPLDTRSYSNLSGSWLYGGYFDYQSTDWQVRLGLTRLELETQLRGEVGRQLAALSAESIPGLEDLLQLSQMSSTFHFATAGVAYDRGPVQAQLMYSYIDSEDAVYPSLHTGYFSLGYRVGRWTPYFTLSMVEASGSPPSPVSGQSEMVDFVNAFIGVANINQRTASLGARYEWSPRIVVKFQADRTKVRHPGDFVLLWSDPDPDWDGRATVFSATVDFVF